jgi:hypothetical protein
MAGLAAVLTGLKLGTAITDAFEDTVSSARRTADVITRRDQKPGYNVGLAGKKGTKGSQLVGQAVAADPPGHYNTPKNFAQRLVSATGSKKSALKALSTAKKVRHRSPKYAGSYRIFLSEVFRSSEVHRIFLSEVFRSSDLQLP